MSIFGSKDKVAKAAQEIADTLRVTEHIKELKKAQAELQDQIVFLDKRLTTIEAGLEKIGAEVKLEALREVQGGLSQMQGTLFSKFSEMAVDIDRIKRLNHKLQNEDDEPKQIAGDGADTLNS